MKDIRLLFDIINKAKVTQRDRFFLYFMVTIYLLLRGITELALAKQLPDLVEWILKLTHVI
jgi:hypothetical protein